MTEPRRPRHKFRAVQCEADGIKFSSQRERARYQALQLAQQQGEVVMFLRQTPFHLPGGVKYVCDFLVFWQDGSCTVEDVKGYRTPQYKAKRKMVEALYPVEITEL